MRAFSTSIDIQDLQQQARLKFTTRLTTETSPGQNVFGATATEPNSIPSYIAYSPATPTPIATPTPTNSIPSYIAYSPATPTPTATPTDESTISISPTAAPTALISASGFKNAHAQESAKLTSTDSSPFSNTIALITDSTVIPLPSKTYLPVFAPTASFSPTATSTMSSSATDLSESTDSSLDSSNKSRASDRDGIIAGSVLGGVFGLVLLIIMVVCILNHKRWLKKNAANKQEDEYWPRESHYYSKSFVYGHDDDTIRGSLDLLNIYNLQDPVARLEPPAEYTPSPFDSEDLLQINRLVKPAVPPRSEDRKYFQYRARPEILPARPAPAPPLHTRPASLSVRSATSSKKANQHPSSHLDATPSFMKLAPGQALQSAEMSTRSCSILSSTRREIPDKSSRPDSDVQSPAGSLISLVSSGRSYDKIHSFPQIPDLVFPSVDLRPPELVASAQANNIPATAEITAEEKKQVHDIADRILHPLRDVAVENKSDAELKDATDEANSRNGVSTSPTRHHPISMEDITKSSSEIEGQDVSHISRSSSVYSYAADQLLLPKNDDETLYEEPRLQRTIDKRSNSAHEPVSKTEKSLDESFEFDLDNFKPVRNTYSR